MNATIKIEESKTFEFEAKGNVYNVYVSKNGYINITQCKAAKVWRSTGKIFHTWDALFANYSSPAITVHLIQIQSLIK